MQKKIAFTFFTVIWAFSAFFNPVSAAPAAITFLNLDNLLNSIILTIQHYTLPTMAVILAFLGVKLLTSGDDTSSKDVIKSWVMKILIGGAIIFGASYLASSIQVAVSAV